MRHHVILIGALLLAACADDPAGDGGPAPAPPAAARADATVLDAALLDGDAAPADATPERDAHPPDASPEPAPPSPDDPCPAGVVCVAELPFVHTADTTTSPMRHIDTYGCAPDTDESGPEVLYRVDLTEPGFLALRLSGLPPGADVDVHLLTDLDPDACLDRGHWTAGALLQPGRYWVVADTWVDADGTERPGAYTLEMGLARPADLAAHGLDPDVAATALHVFAAAWVEGHTDRLEYAITDFSRHSAEPRQWIVDLATGDLLWHLHVAHGRGYADAEDATARPTFSNVPESHQSSLGLMRAAEPYTGDYGYSFRLDGLEPGYNDNVRRRDIVMHPWEGSRPAYVAEHGRVQPTWGCPAIDDQVAPAVVDALAGGALMWFWYPDGDWSEGSRYLP